MFYTHDSAVLIDPISTNKGITSQGYLVANNALIARTGVQYYLSQELGLKDEAGKPVIGKTIKVYRLPEDVFAPQALQSLESAPITDDHPEALDGVTVETHHFLAKGHGRNIRQADESVAADLVITDPGLIKKVQDKQKIQISVGYTCNYEPYKDGYKQTNIIANHIAVVLRGRAGERVKIYDSQINRRVKPVFKNQKEAQSAMFAAFCKDATPEEIQAVMPFITANDAAPVAEKTNEVGLLAKLVGMMTAKSVKDTEGDEDEEEKKEKTEDSKILAALDALNARFDALEAKVNDADEDEEDEEDKKKTEDADGDDEDEDEEEKKKAEDALTLAKLAQDMKPFIAKLPKSERKAANDAIRKALGKTTGGGAYAEILKTIQAKSRDSQPESPADLGLSIAQKFNPHYKKQA